MRNTKIMSFRVVYFVVIIVGLAGCNFVNKEKTIMSCSDPKCTSNTTVACALTSPELRARKATVIASLQRQLLEKKELKDGYAFRFAGTDSMVDELTDFIKTERQCCDFFTFNLSVKGDKSTAWLELTGPDGAKEFIVTELGL